MTPYLLAIPVLLILYQLWGYLLRRYQTSFCLPPGPRGLPIFGSFFDVLSSGSESEAQWATYLKMGKKYQSDVVHINVLRDHTIILNSAKAAEELLDKRSGIYSSRPPLHMANDLSGWNWNMAIMQYSSRWRLHRRVFHQHFRSDAVAIYLPFIRRATSHFLGALASTMESTTSEMKHENLQNIVHQHVGSIILYATYGMTKQEDLDDYVQLVYSAAESMIATMRHGNFMVDYFPLLKYVPAWFPGALFKRKAKKWTSFSSDLVNKPWDKLKASISSGTATPCFGTRALETFDLLSASDSDSADSLDKSSTNIGMEEVIRNCAGAAYLGGTDTSISLIMISILVLSHHPEIQARAQEELDKVVGSNQLPDFGNREELPYVEALFKEILRMYPSVPLGVPHYGVADDIYEGYFIPKGTTVVGNAWAILHDEELYPDPLTFNPDRFMKTENNKLNPDPELYAFGFGRRICPGRHLALNTSWLVLASLLTTCTITRASGGKSEGINPVADFADGLVVHPKPFKCCISPRSTAAFELMKTGYEAEILEGE